MNHQAICHKLRVLVKKQERSSTASWRRVYIPGLDRIGTRECRCHGSGENSSSSLLVNSLIRIRSRNGLHFFRRIGSLLNIGVDDFFDGARATHLCANRHRSSGDRYAAARNRFRSRSKLVRPYIWRLISLRRLTWPSVWPLLHSRVSAA